MTYTIQTYLFCPRMFVHACVIYSDIINFIRALLSKLNSDCVLILHDFECPGSIVQDYKSQSNSKFQFVQEETLSWGKEFLVRIPEQF